MKSLEGRAVGGLLLWGANRTWSAPVIVHSVLASIYFQSATGVKHSKYRLNTVE